MFSADIKLKLPNFNHKDTTTIARLIQALPSSNYASKNLKGELVLVRIIKGVSMELDIYKESRWVRVETYNRDGELVDTRYKGQW